ncbi:Primosomal protein N' [Frankliniella fusca]|uniref:Primosomal protein N n=1 Tax=Frankliniella fusca TaxID=407009 RepID=A0AAE1LKB0_9NEOP|nr:Primosomal protein N' [Frankliniella fusca]
MKDGLVQEELFESFMGQDAKRRPDRMHLNPKGMDVIEEALKTVPPFQPPTYNQQNVILLFKFFKFQALRPVI